MQKIVGNALKTERELRGISLDEISREMNITLRYLTALENEEFSLIPGDFYVKYYIKCYLKALGADETNFFNKYKDYLDQVFAKKETEPQDLYIEKLRYARFRRKKIVRRVILAAVVLTTTAISAYLLLAPRNAPTKDAEPQPPLAIPEDSGLFFLPAARFCDDDSPVSVSIDCVERCWIQVTRNGEKIAERNYEKGEGAIFRGYRLSILLGNPSGVRVLVNGREIPALSRSAIPVQLDLSPDNLESLLRR
jgi:cytoskeletal protein RodZ